MMEAAPSAPFIVPEPDLLLELLIIPLDTPAQLGEVDELAEADFRRQRREPIFGRLDFALGPLDQQPLLRCQFRDQPIMPDPNAYTRKARRQPIGRPFPPSDRTPSMLGQSKRYLLGRDQIGFIATSRIVQRFASPFGPGARWPQQGIRLNAGHVDQPQGRHAAAQPRVIAIGGVHQSDAARKAGLARPAQLLERNLRFGLEADVQRYAGLVPTLTILG